MIGDKIKQLRQDRNWTLEDLAERTGLCASTIHTIERGNTIPIINTVVVIARQFGVTVDYLAVEPIVYHRDKLKQPVLSLLSCGELAISTDHLITDPCEVTILTFGKMSFRWDKGHVFLKYLGEK